VSRRADLAAWIRVLGYWLDEAEDVELADAATSVWLSDVRGCLLDWHGSLPADDLETVGPLPPMPTDQVAQREWAAEAYEILDAARFARESGDAYACCGDGECGCYSCAPTDVRADCDDRRCSVCRGGKGREVCQPCQARRLEWQLRRSVKEVA
jgi:hypothetical protein